MSSMRIDFSADNVTGLKWIWTEKCSQEKEGFSTSTYICIYSIDIFFSGVQFNEDR